MNESNKNCQPRCNVDFGASDGQRERHGDSDMDQESVLAIKQPGIAVGRNDNKFAPNATATRSESVTIVLKLLQVSQ